MMGKGQEQKRKRITEARNLMKDETLKNCEDKRVKTDGKTMKRNAVIITRMLHDRFLLNPLQSILSIRCFIILMLQASLNKPAEVFSGAFSKDRGSHAEGNKFLHRNVDFLERLNNHRILRNIRNNRKIHVFNEGWVENKARMRENLKEMGHFYSVRNIEW